MIRFSPFINDYSSNGIPLIRMKPQPILKEIGVQFKKESKIFVTPLSIIFPTLFMDDPLC